MLIWQPFLTCRYIYVSTQVIEMNEGAHVQLISSDIQWYLVSPGQGGCCGDTGAGAGCRAPLGLQGDLTMHNSASAQLDTLDTRDGYELSRSLKFHNHREGS